MTTMPGPAGQPPPDEPGTAQAFRRYRGWLTLAAVVMVAGCAGATWWQVRRALGGNLPSDFYAVMWPMYGGYVIYLWLRLRSDAASLAGHPDSDPQPDDGDEELRAYNRYLASKRADAQRRAR